MLRGRTRRYQLDAADISGPLDRQVEEACRFVAKNMKVAAFKSLGRVDLKPLRQSPDLEAARASGMPVPRSRGSEGPIGITVQFRESGGRLATYVLEIASEKGRVVVAREVLRYRRGRYGSHGTSSISGAARGMPSPMSRSMDRSTRATSWARCGGRVSSRARGQDEPSGLPARRILDEGASGWTPSAAVSRPAVSVRAPRWKPHAPAQPVTQLSGDARRH